MGPVFRPKASCGALACLLTDWPASSATPVAAPQLSSGTAEVGGSRGAGTGLGVGTGTWTGDTPTHPRASPSASAASTGISLAAIASLGCLIVALQVADTQLPTVPSLTCWFLGAQGKMRKPSRFPASRERLTIEAFQPIYTEGPSAYGGSSSRPRQNPSGLRSLARMGCLGGPGLSDCCPAHRLR